MGTEHQEHDLKPGLTNRHIQLIALGGAVGTGLFYGISKIIYQTGPSILLGYLIAGVVAFFIMRQLAEMIVEEPGAGSFSYFAHRYWGNFAGYCSGWNYWMLYILVGMSELTACAQALQFWWPIPGWLYITAIFLIVLAINLAAVKFYGEAEFIFAMIKVLTIIGIIVYGLYLLLSGKGGPEASITNLWQYGGFFPNGIKALVMSMTLLMFSFGGLELIGITAAESHEPRKSIPKATNQVIYRILIFYVGAVSILLCLVPWTHIVPQENVSPFVLLFQNINGNIVANVLNFVVFTALLSAYNSAAYCTSRMLYGLSRQGNAPKCFGEIIKRGIPFKAIMASASATVICIALNYWLPENALEILMSLVVSSLILNWVFISFTHIKFRQVKNKQGITTYFRTWFYPWSNYFCLVFLIGIIVLMLMTPGLYISALLIPIWLGFLGLSYVIRFVHRTSKQ